MLTIKIKKNINNIIRYMDKGYLSHGLERSAYVVNSEKIYLHITSN